MHPTFKVGNPEKASVKFTAVDGTEREIGCAEPGEIVLRGSDRPNGELLSSMPFHSSFSVNEHFSKLREYKTPMLF